MNEFYEAWERYYDDAIMAQSRKYTHAWKKAFADEAVRNCNTNPRSANTVADAQVEPEIAKTKETQ